MAKTLVINNADFETNSLDIVSYDVIPCTGISVSPNTATITSIGDTTTATATVSPLNCTEPVVWTTSDSSIATVSNGVITAKAVGTATITATCGNYSSSVSVTVSIPVVPCTGISLSESSVSIVTTGNTDTVTASVTPQDCTDTVVWTTSDSDVATVVNGVITAEGIGTATITATCGNYSDTVSVTVTEFMDKTILKKMSGLYVGGNTASEGGNGLTAIQTSSTYKNRGTLASSEGVKYANDFSGNHFYPYVMPKNTKRIKITDTGSSGIKKQTVLWYNHLTKAGETTLEDYCKLIGSTGLTSESSTTITINVPSYEGFHDIDSLIIMFRTYKTGTTFTDADFDDVTVEFLTAET